MKKSIVEKNGITPEVIEVIGNLVKQVPWPEKRQSMAQITINLLDGKPRVAESVFGWGRSTVELGMNELRESAHSDLPYIFSETGFKSLTRNFYGKNRLC